MKKLVLGVLLFGSLVIPWGAQATSAEAKFIFKNNTNEVLKLKLSNDYAEKFYVDGVSKETYNVPTLSKGQKSDVITVKSVNWQGGKPVLSMDAAGNKQNIGYVPGKTYEITITDASSLGYTKDIMGELTTRTPSEKPSGEKTGEETGAPEGEEEIKGDAQITFYNDTQEDLSIEFAIQTNSEGTLWINGKKLSSTKSEPYNVPADGNIKVEVSNKHRIVEIRINDDLLVEAVYFEIGKRYQATITALPTGGLKLDNKVIW